MKHLLSKIMEQDIFKPAGAEDVAQRKEHDRKFQDYHMQSFYKTLRDEGMEEEAAVAEVIRRFKKYNEAKDDIFKPASKEDQAARDAEKHQKAHPDVSIDDIEWAAGIAPGYEDDIAELLQFYYAQGKRAGKEEGTL